MAGESSQARGWLSESGLEKSNRVVVSSRDQGEPDLDFADVVVIGTEERPASQFRRLPGFTRPDRAGPIGEDLRIIRARARSRSTIALHRESFQGEIGDPEL